MFLAFGIVCAVLEASKSGQGQVVDAAMVDGVAILTTMFHGLIAQGRWNDVPGTNFADTGAPFYEVFETADGEYISIGAIERPFYKELLERLGLDEARLSRRSDESVWPTLKEQFAALFATKTRDEWCTVLEGTDACFAPVLSLREAPLHPHNVARSTFLEHDGVVQPAPAPRFSRTRPELDLGAPRPGEHSDAVLLDWEFDSDEIAELRDSGAIE